MQQTLAFGALFLAGFAGSLHCIGMCGAIACAAGADQRGRAAALRHQLLYNLGRITSYGFLGALVGYFGFLLVAECGDDSIVSVVQRGLAALSGVLLVVIGLQFFGVLGRRSHGLGAGGQMLAQALRALTRAPGAAAPLALGVFNGFLPCPLVYAVAAQAAISGGPASGLLTMLVFGLGTFPALLAVAAIGQRLTGNESGATPQPITIRFFARSLRGLSWRDWPGQVLRQHGVRVAGALIVLVGLITLARGLVPMSHVHLP